MRKDLLIIGFVWPEPKSSAAGLRMMQLIETFQKDNFQVTFASPCAKSDNAFNLEDIGVHQVTIALNNSSFDAFIEKLNPKVVLFDRFMMEEQFGWRVIEHCPNALRVLDTEDLHCLRKGRQQAFKKGDVFDNAYLFNDIAKREIATIYRCDLSLMISEVEIEILINQFKVDKELLLYVPFMLNSILEEDIKLLPDFDDRQHFVTIGNFLHEPNYNAVLYLKNVIWPLISKQLPKAELHVYGAYASQKVTQLNNKKDRFFIKGFAESAHSVMQQAKVCLAAIRFGAGLKGKLVDAMQNGTPMVTTSIGAEGMFGDFEANGFIENDPQEFAHKAVQLYQKESLWKSKRKNGFLIINKRFSKLYYQQILLNAIEKTTSHLNEKRLNNFMGQMLQHHTMQSTKFMSKWIEEKNKN
ncbi:glycosyltransferase family 4 protein [uncultured Algibacter sp.]|uniref:glycosyltransferase n=1 Tax=uncultured Algibacter sp. TaxID=298659 RepID=UPI00261FD08B|nr:glycosyltransferase family 4 protein [uncultured Algibacter sp.]